MKLRNKKTGEIGYFISKNWNETVLIIMDKNGVQLAKYNSLAELNADWEDYEETKEWYWYIEDDGVIQRSCHYEDLHPALDKARKDIGNYFETREEAEKAVEKLKAVKRLKDKGFRFTGEGKIFNCISYEFDCDYCLIAEDCRLLFGGEE